MDLKTKLLDLLLRGVPPRARHEVYRLGPLARIARRILTPTFQPSRLRDVTVSSGSLKGARLSLDLSCEKSLWLGTYEIEVERLLCEKALPSGICCDIGAHIGYFAVHLARLVGPTGQVIAFEPHPANAERLRRNVVMNGYSNVRVETLALSNRSGTGSLHGKPGNGSSEFYLGAAPLCGVRPVAGRPSRPGAAPRGHHGMNVEVLTLDGWLRKHRDVRPSLLKIDVEGAEGLVLAGARKTLLRDRPVVVCEIHGEAPGRAAWRELKRAGYRIETVEARRTLTRPPAGGHIVALPPREAARFTHRTPQS